MRYQGWRWGQRANFDKLVFSPVLPRCLRIEFPAVFYLMMARGNRREIISHELLGICFVREAPERANGPDRRAGKWGLSACNKNPEQREPSGVFCVQESGSGVHLVVLFQGGENRLELKQVEARSDLDVGDHSFSDPGIDGSSAHR